MLSYGRPDRSSVRAGPGRLHVCEVDDSRKLKKSFAELIIHSNPTGLKISIMKII